MTTKYQLKSRTHSGRVRTFTPQLSAAEQTLGVISRHHRGDNLLVISCSYTPTHATCPGPPIVSGSSCQSQAIIQSWQKQAAARAAH